MELKEFSHKGEAIEKEIKKEFQFMGRTIKKRRVGLIIAAAGDSGNCCCAFYPFTAV